MTAWSTRDEDVYVTQEKVLRVLTSFQSLDEQKISGQLHRGDPL